MMADKAKTNWQYMKHTSDGDEHIEIFIKDGRITCPLGRLNWYGDDDVNAEEDEARAKLVIQAPRMFALIEKLAKQYENTDAPTGIEAQAIVNAVKV